MSTSTDDAIEELKNKLRDYKIGDKIGLQRFSDADPEEMKHFGIRIGVFGQTGAGKSALINTVSKILGSADAEVAISQSAGGEGTRVFEEFAFGGFSMFDTRGFFNIDSPLEETEFFRILYGGVRPGEDIDRGNLGILKTKFAGTAAHKLNKPPLKRQLHVVLWIIKGADVRLINDDYRDRLNFILSNLGQETITLVTVITHGDVIDQMDNPSEFRKDIIAKARDATKSLDCHTFLVRNWTENMAQLDDNSVKDVLNIIHTALECGERSVKMRQSKRRRLELKAEREARLQNRPSESDETTNPNDKNYKYKYNNL